MATIKHITSKNADYGATEAYLIFQHDEFTKKPLLDGSGRMVLREDYRITTLGCGDEDFALSCIRANTKWGKNNAPEDIKGHHYIISFDPRDADENGLTLDRAQELGVKFCAEHFPGHQATVCTHPDGHNESGNIHVHIVINSLRIEEVEHKYYMDKACDTRAGDKHRCTAATLYYLRSEVMAICLSAGLYQIDLLHGRKSRVTEREYWAQKKGQLALNAENATLAEQGVPVKQKRFETDKESLRKIIRKAISESVSFEEFSEKLLQMGISVHESRGAISYLTPDRTKPIRARQLGDDFEKTAIIAELAVNAQLCSSQPDDSLKRGAIESAHAPDRMERIVPPPQQPVIKHDTPMQRGVQNGHPFIGCINDPQKYIDAGKSRAYVDKVKVSNLKNMAKTFNFYQQHEFSSLEEVDAVTREALLAYEEKRAEIKVVETQIAEKKKLHTAVTNYRKTLPVIKQYYALSGKKQQQFRDEHDGDFRIFEAAKKALADMGYDKKFPAGKVIEAEITALYQQKSALYTEYNPLKEQYNTMLTVRTNFQKMVPGRNEPTRKEVEK